MIRRVPKEVREWVEQQRRGPNRERITEIERIVFHSDMLPVWETVTDAAKQWANNRKRHWNDETRSCPDEFAAILCAKDGQRFVTKAEQEEAIIRRDGILRCIYDLRTHIASDPLGKRMVFHGMIGVEDWRGISRSIAEYYDGIPPGINPDEERAANLSLDDLLTEIESMFCSDLYPPYDQNPSPHTPKNNSATAGAQILYGQLVDWMKYAGADWDDNGPILFSGNPNHGHVATAVRIALRRDDMDPDSLRKQYNRKK